VLDGDDRWTYFYFNSSQQSVAEFEHGVLRCTEFFELERKLVPRIVSTLELGLRDRVFSVVH